MKIILIILALFLMGCGSYENRARSIESKYVIIIIDSCEYIVSKAPLGDYGWLMSHKGNCKNPIHYKNK
jgi:hypothetical protein